MLEIRVLGSFAIEYDGQLVHARLPAKETALLIYLACTARSHSREELADLLWDDRAPEQARSNLRTVLSNLQRRFPLPPLTVTHDSVALDPRTGCWLDAAVLQAEIAALIGRQGQDKPIEAGAVERLARALDLYTGDFAAGFHIRGARGFEEWVTVQREALCQQAIKGLCALTEFYLGHHRYGDGIEAARRWLALDPLSEAAHRQMMTLLALDGRCSAALIQYQTCRLLLADDLQIEPQPETSALRDQIRQGLLGTNGAAAAPDNPYKGLRPFDESDAARFFGRETMVGRLYLRLTAGRGRFLAVVGPSGSGKSSLLRAGLAPAVRGHQSWPIVQVAPGAQPWEALAAALEPLAGCPLPGLPAQLEADGDGLSHFAGSLAQAGGAAGLLLIVDHLEEMFTLVDDQETRARFLHSLSQAATTPGGCLRLVVALRSDFYDRALRHAEFGSLATRQIETMTPLTSHELWQAIVEPAAAAGLAVEPELVACLVSDVSKQPGALPLLQHTLAKLFERRQGSTMTLTAYEEMGGLTGVLREQAEAAYAGLGEVEQQAAQRLFLRLVEQNGGDARQRTRQRDLEALAAEPPELAAVTAALVRGRLLTCDRDPASGEPTVELAHEALPASWPRLRGWLEARQGEAHLQHRLAALEAAWGQARARRSSAPRDRQIKPVGHEAMMAPQRRQDVIHRSAGRQTLLYDPAADAIHVLNPTALFVWDLCDGQHAPAQIEALLRARFAATRPEDVADDVQAVLALFRDEGLLVGEAP